MYLHDVNKEKTVHVCMVYSSINLAKGGAGQGGWGAYGVVKLGEKERYLIHPASLMLGIQPQSACDHPQAQQVWLSAPA